MMLLYDSISDIDNGNVGNCENKDGAVGINDGVLIAMMGPLVLLMALMVSIIVVTVMGVMAGVVVVVVVVGYENPMAT